MSEKVIFTTNQNLLMKKLYFLLLSFFLTTGFAAMSQCNNGSAFGTANAPTTNAPVTITTCAFAGEYSTINNCVAGQTYQFTATGGTGNFITIRQGTPGGTVLGFGTSPVSVVCTVSGPLYLHYNTNAACGTDFSCHTGVVQCTSCPPPAIPNDLCTGAININCGQTISGTTVGAGVDAVGTCVTSLGTAPGVWYTFVGNGAPNTLTMCTGTTYDSKIGVFTGTCGSLVCVTGNDDFCGLQSQVTFATTSGTTYYVLVTGFGSAAGAFTLTRTSTLPNDACTGAIPISCGQTINGSTACGASVDAVSFCGTSLNTAPGLWYSMVGDGAPVTLSLCGSTYDTKIGVFTGTCGSLVCVTGNDDFCGLQSQVSFNTNAGVTYYILVTGFGTATGSFTLTRTCAPACTGVPSPGAITPATSTVCAGTSVTLTASGYSANSGLAFQWRQSATPGGPYTNIPGATSNIYTFTAAATRYYTCTVTCTNPGGGSGTTAEVVVNVGAPTHTSVTATPATVCSPGATTITGTVTGGLGSYTHTLTGPGTIVQNPPSGPNNSTGNFSVTNIPTGNHVYVFTSTDGAGCMTSTNVNVLVNATPVVTITPAAPVICAGDVQMLSATVVPGVTQTFGSALSMTIPGTGTGASTGAPANPYPSTIAVSGLPTAGVVVANVSLNNFAHTFPDDVDVVLVSPAGQSVILMSDVGGGADATGQTFTFNDAAASLMADGAFNPTGTYRPTNIGTGDNWPAPGPLATPTSTTLSTFTGNPNGNWNLYVVDDAGIDIGSLGGWNIVFSIPAPVIFSPTTNLFTDPAATTAYTGTPTNVVYAKPPTTTVYTATATVNGCTSAPASVTVTVNQLPAITVQPAALPAPVCPGFNVNYSVTATGAGLTYQWQVSTDNGATWSNIADGPQYSGVTTNNLTVLNVSTSQNNYRYRVVVSGTCPPSATSNSVTLVVATPPTITTQPTSRTVCAGVNTTFTVVATGVPAPTIYQWQVSTNGGGTWTNLTTGGSYTPSFTITGVTTTMNANQYRVIVTNSCGQSVTSSAAVLTVNPLPVVTATAISGRICISDGPIALSGSPVGGSWSGIGVSGFDFVPASTAVGTYTLTYTFTNSFGCTATSSIIAKVEDCQERLRLLRDNAVILYPNPNNGNFSIRINSVLYNYLGMNVYSTSGQLLKQQTFTGLSYGRVIPIDLTFLPSGTYMVKFFYDDGIRTSEKTFPVVIGRN